MLTVEKLINDVVLLRCNYCTFPVIFPGLLTSFTPCRNGSELDDTALAEGGVGGVLLRIPTVARKQVMHAGAA